MKNDDLLTKIRNLTTLTPSDSKIADYIEKKYPFIAFETIHSISKKVQVGTATIGRFVVRLGYDSFSDFMKAIQQEVVNRLETPIERFSSRKSDFSGDNTDFLNQHIQYTLKILNETQSRVKPEDLRKAARIIANCSGRVYVSGASSAYGLAYFFSMLAMYMKENVTLLNPSPAELAHTLIDVSADDVLFSITNYRFSEQNVQTSKWFHKKGAKIVLLSDRELTPISKMATVQLFAYSAGPPMFNSRCGTIVILEALLSAMAVHLDERVVKRFEVFEQLRDEFKIFATWNSLQGSNALYESTGTSEAENEEDVDEKQNL